MARFPDCELWDFSVAVYAREGVAPACLALQARNGVDVNLLLYFCWLGASGRGPLDEALLARAKAAVERWHGEVVRGLRAVRARLKREAEPAPPRLAAALRKRIGAVELEAEHIEQLALAALAPPLAGVGQPARERAKDASGNAIRYLGSLGGGRQPQDREYLVAVLAGCFPGLALSELRRLVEA
jgi:uncharacterized protein (TIGR02444 family)